jgi:DnaK suppressor protein
MSIDMTRRKGTETRVNIDNYRRRLQQIEQELVRRLGGEAETLRTSRDDVPDAGDAARDDEMKDQFFALAETDSEILSQVRMALGRIDAGTYGRCIVDAEPIDPKRLDSVPWTPYCLKHQAEAEERMGPRTPSM